MVSSSRGDSVLYVSAQPARRIDGDHIRVVSPAEMETRGAPTTADWILVDAAALQSTPPAWITAAKGRVGLVAAQTDDLPRWVDELDLPVFDSNLVSLVRSIASDVADVATNRVAEQFGAPLTAQRRPLDLPEMGVDTDDTRIGESLSAMPYPMALLDRNGVVLWTNRVWAEFGVENGRPTTDSDVGTDYLETCDAAESDFAETAATAIRTVLGGDAESERVEYPCHGDGVDRWYAMDVAAVDGPGPVRAVVSHLDVTHYKQRINVLDRVLRHNLRNKANIILGHAAALASSRDDETATAAMTIGAAARELLSLSEQARKYQEVSVDEELPAAIDVNRVVEEVTERIQETYPDAIVETALPAVAFARGSRSVALVIRELLENAVVHNDGPDPWVRIEVRTDNGVAILVADDGPGIPDPDRRLLTGAAVERPVRHGSQLGVWVVNSLVRSLGGRIDVYDRSPHGSVVTVTLPGADGPETADAVDAVSATDPVSNAPDVDSNRSSAN